jgi:uncharacterized membrane protein YecN with MAPEG domain
MELVAIIASLALAEYLVFMMRAGMARGRYGVAAPATHGHPQFERNLRVQENTVEQLVVFLPSIFLFGHYVSPGLAALLGLVFITGRALYAYAYVNDPARRGPGFLMTLLANALLLLGGLVGALVDWL